jgi:uncharacterized RDD family membrane protein YckC
MSTDISLGGSAQARCAECGRTFATSDMIRHGSAHICASCKPIFMQKLVEGAEIRSGLRFAGFWRRFAAVLLDGLIVGIVNGVLQVFAVFATLRSAADAAAPAFGPLLASYFLSLAIACAYETVLIGKYGVTVGKMVCRIEVVTADGGSVTYARAFGRYWAKMLSSFTLFIGYIIAVFDEQKRSLHDRICNTRVIIR